MLKYRHAFVVGLQSNLVYRWNFAVRSLFSIFHLAFVFIFWGAIYSVKADIGGFGFAQTLTYFVVLFLLQFLIGAFNEDYLISEDIRNGLINQFLLKPINYFAYRLSVFAAARVVTGAFGLMALLVAVPFFRNYLVFPHDGWRIALGIPAMALTALIQFSIAYCFGMLAFWFLEIQGFVILSMAVETVLGGQFFPLDLLPPSVFRAVSYLPFYYQAYFPNAILTGRIGLDAAVRGLAIQAVWAFVLVCLAEAVWRRGLRHHTAAGG
jgi:ABC-2 type transport system permease protein